MRSPIAAVVLAAGAGTRMKSSLPKVLHQVAGKPMLRHVLDSVARLKPARVVGVIAPGADQVAAATLDAVRAGSFLALPHPEVLDMYRHKGSDYDRWIAGMRRYQHTLG